MASYTQGAQEEAGSGPSKKMEALIFNRFLFLMFLHNKETHVKTCKNAFLQFNAVFILSNKIFFALIIRS